MDFDVFGKGALQARLYDPIIGRWWSIDPLRAKYAGMSPYNYAAGNPISILDKKGGYIEWDPSLSQNDRKFTISIYQSNPIMQQAWKDFESSPNKVFITSAFSEFAKP